MAGLDTRNDAYTGPGFRNELLRIRGDLQDVLGNLYDLSAPSPAEVDWSQVGATIARSDTGALRFVRKNIPGGSGGSLDVNSVTVCVMIVSTTTPPEHAGTGAETADSNGRVLARTNTFWLNPDTAQLAVYDETAAEGSRWRAILGGTSGSQVVLATTGPHTLTAAVTHVLVDTDAAGGDVAVALPDPAEPVQAELVVKMTGAHQTTLTVDGGADIEGSTSYVLAGDGEFLRASTFGTSDWWKVGSL